MLSVQQPPSLADLINPSNLNEALHNYHNHLALATLPLAKLATVRDHHARLSAEEASKAREGRPVVPSPNPLGAALAAEIKSLVAALEPKDPALPASHNRRYPYEILHQTAILGRNATDVAARLFISRSQLYRIREKTLQDLCQLWIERETSLLAQTVPASISLPNPTSAELPAPNILPASTIVPPPTTTPTLQPQTTLHPSSFIPHPSPNGFRVVSVLVASLTNFNKVAASLDPEEAHALLNHLRLALDEPIKARAGFVANWYERRLSALFGAPVAHENDPLRAVQVGLDLHVALANARTSWQGRPPTTWPSLRIAISTGRVFAGTLGPTSEQRYSVTGATLDLAQTLTDRTPAGWLLIEQQTYKQVRGLFEIEALEAVQLGEEAEPSEVAVYRVLAARPQGELIGVRGVQGVETEMIGRDPEWSLVSRLYAECRELNSVRQLTIVGPGGSGKSRLEYEFRQFIELQPHRTHYWRGQVDQNVGQPYRPFADMLRTAVGLTEEDRAEHQREKLLQFCKPLFKAAGELGGLSRAEEVAQLLSVILEIGWPGSPALNMLENQPSLAQWHTFRAFAALCAAVTALTSRYEPLVLVLEDLHWAEEATLALWNYLGAELEDAPIMLIGLTRPDLYERKPDWGLGLDRHFRLDLKPLPPARTRELVRHILRKLPETPAYLVEQITQAADGNPFYVEEIINMLREDGVLLDDEKTGSWQLARAVPDPLPAPPTVEGLIQARLDQMPPDERRLLELATIVGRDFSAPMLRSLLTATGEPDTGEELESQLARLQRRELIVGRALTSLGPSRETGFNFKHSLLREVIYSSLPRQRRVSLHRVLAEWLEERHRQAGGVLAAALADQFERAGLADRAVAYYEEAAEEARTAFALAEAADYYEKALVGLDRQAQPGRCAHLLIRHAQIEVLQANYTRSQADLEEARPLLSGELVERLEWRLLQAEAAERLGQYDPGIQECREGLRELEESGLADLNGLRMLLKAQLGNLLFRKSRYNEAEAVLREALTDWQGQPEVEDQASWREMRALAGCYKNLSLVLWARGDLKEAISYFEYILPLYGKISDWAGQAACYDNLGLIYRDKGDLAQAEEYYDKARLLFDKVGDRHRAIYTQVNLGMIYWFKGELDRAETTLKTAQAFYELIGGRFGQAVCANNLGQIYRDKGDPGQAEAKFQHSLALSLVLGDERGAAFSYNNQAKLARDKGDFDRAIELATTALELRRKIGHRYGEAASQLVLGWLNMEQTGDDQGEFEAARLICEAIDYKFGLAEAWIGLAALYLNKRTNEVAALELLNKAYTLAKSSGFRETQLQAMLWLGRYAEFSGRPAEAAEWFEQLLALAGPYYPFYTRQAHLRLAEQA